MGLRRFLVLSHRWLGIVLCLLFVLWFASGFVITYTKGMPTQSEAERLAHMPVLNLEAVRISPAQAGAIINSRAAPVLHTVMERPAYRFPGRQGRVVFADDGRVLDGSILSSSRIVARYTGAREDLIERVERLEDVDQWTILQRGELPLEKFRVDDGSGTEVYVSPRWGQVILSTTRGDRILAWLGAIPHWLYWVELRRDAELWTEVVIWLSGIGTVLALVGMIMIFTQLRRVSPFSFSRAIPYRGLMRWHYLTGLVFGLVTLTWIFSGLLSMQPWQWNQPGGLDLPRDALQGGPLELETFDGLLNPGERSRLLSHGVAGELKEISFRRRGESHYYELTVSSEDSHWGHVSHKVDARSLVKPPPLAVQDIRTRLAAVAPGHEIVSAELLEAYDGYYYDRQESTGPTAPLPVVRIKFNDPQSTWFYANPESGDLLLRIHGAGRLDRWLYNGLHSLDFSFLYARRPLWDIAVLLLLAGGLAMVTIGTILGFQRLHRNARRFLAKF